MYPYLGEAAPDTVQVMDDFFEEPSVSPSVSHKPTPALSIGTLEDPSDPLVLSCLADSVVSPQEVDPN